LYKKYTVVKYYVSVVWISGGAVLEEFGEQTGMVANSSLPIASSLFKLCSPFGLVGVRYISLAEISGMNGLKALIRVSITLKLIE
jgi:hypothetical protein